MQQWGDKDVHQTESGYDLSDEALAEVMSESFGGNNRMSYQITWGNMKDWANQNKVTDDAIIGDMDTGEFAIDMGFTPANPDQDEPAIFEIEFGDVDE